MLQDLVNLLPDGLVHWPPARAGVCVGVGALLWLCGARFSRSILTLVAVAGGTVIGMHLPAWCGWQVDGMGLGVGGAIVLGSIVFLFHGACIGLLLGGGMMLWAGTAVWLAMAGDGHWDWRAVHWEGDMIQFCRQAWEGLPHGVSRVFPVACLAGLAGGITIAVFLPRLAKALAHSLVGVTLMTVMGALAVRTAHPGWLPSSAKFDRSQALVLIGLVVAGAVLQWLVTPPARAPGSKAARQS
jgi:hypothetical protein